MVYIGVLGVLPGQRFATYLPVVVYIALFLLASIGLRQAIARWPGHYPARRIFGMVHDYTGTCFGLVLGGEAALPLYAVIIWVNLGNGMRYGSRYLAIATGLALLALLAVYRLTPVWQAQPYMVLMLMLTSTVIPFYAHLLLERTRKASEEAVAANLEKSRFLAQASHDLRQPIHSIGLFTACLRESRLGEQERQLVDNMTVRCSTSRSCSVRFLTSTPSTTGASCPGCRCSIWASGWPIWSARTPKPRAGPVWNCACVRANTGYRAIRRCSRPWCRTCFPTASNTARNARC
jgi:hypothetical protein